jgi:MFS family permease
MSQSPWAPFKHLAFRSLWLGALAMNLATLMQNAGAAWLMVSLTSSPLLVGLMQTASTLPGFIFSLPGGVLADLVNRRRLLLTTQLWLLCGALLLGVFSLCHWITPWSLLAVTAVLGIGFAVQTPAWHTSQAEAVPRDELPAALALSTTSYNAARAVGPALAGLLVAIAGVSAVFAASAAGFVASLVLLVRWKRPEARSQLPSERLVAGVRSALRYVRHSAVVREQLLRAALFTAAASGLWALLPLLARDELHFGAGGYGLLLGSLGVGAIAGAFSMYAIRARLGLNGAASLGVVAYSSAVFLTSMTHNPLIVVLLLVLAGGSWMIVGNTNLSAVQTAIPSWVRARVMAVYLLTFQGAMAAGGVVWGTVATAQGIRASLTLSAASVMLTLIVLRRLPARIGDESEMTLSNVADAPSLAHAEDPEEGPVAVEISYQVRPGAREEFIRAAHGLGKSRRRDGANVWRLYRDLSDPNRYVERFLVDSWSEYLRHRARATVADHEVHLRIASMLIEGASPKMEHYIAEGVRPSQCDETRDDVTRGEVR